MNTYAVKTAILSVLIVVGVLMTMPTKAYAVDFNPFNPLDPFCLFSNCGDSQPQNVDNSINNSYNNNTNSFNEGTGGTVYATPYTITTPYAPVVPTTHVTTYHQPVYVETRPVYIPTTPVYTYSQPTYYYSSPLSVSCRANTTYTNTGSYVTWTAYPSGGYNNYSYNTYTYSWSGTDGVYGGGSSISAYYNSPGQKYANVTVYSNGQSATAYCGNSVTVGGTYYYNQYPVYNNPYPVYSNNIQVACAADTTSTRIGVPVTWVAEAAQSGYQGGNFTYSWSGSNGLYGSNSTAIANYSSSGVKTATVTVTSPNGQSASAACRNTVTVKSAVVAKPVVKAPVVQAPVPTPPPVNPVLTLGNVPWGWVGVLVILMLMGIIFYLIFNKKKL